MTELEDDLDELALDNIGTSPSKEPRRACNRPSSRINELAHVRASPVKTPSALGRTDFRMSSSRYPKRRRVSGRDKEPTPPPPPSRPSIPQSEEKRSYDSSPDELAPTSPHAKSRPNRTTSKLKRSTKDKKKSLPEIHKVPTAAVITETPIDAPNLTTVAPETGDDEPETSTVAVADDEPKDEEKPLSGSVKDEEEYADEQDIAVPDPPAPIEDLPNEQTPDAQLAMEVPHNDNADETSIPSDTIEEPEASTFEDHPTEPGVAQASIESHDLLEIPSFRRRSTFRGSFLKVEPRPSPDRYISKSPPPYSRVSTPLGTPRELPTAPPQYVPYREKMTLKGHKRSVAAVKFSPDGNLIASCSADATIRIWETSTGKHLHTLEGHLAGISTIAWMPDSKVIASGSDDKSIRLWYVGTGKMHPRQLTGHSSYVYSLAFSPKGNMLASGSYDEALFLWDVRTQRLMRSHPAHSDPVGGVDFVRDGTLIVSCSSDGLIRVWDTATGQCLRTLVHEDNAGVTGVCFVPNGKFILAWTLDSSIRLWNYVEGRCMKTYQGHQNEKFSLSGAVGVYTNKDDSERRAFVVSGSEDGKIFTWDLQSKEILQTMEGHEGVVLGVDTWEEGNLMVSCGVDRTIRIWEKTQEPGSEEKQGVSMTTAHEEDTIMKDEEREEIAVNPGDNLGEDATINGELGAQSNGPLVESTKDEDIVNGVNA